ncbi:IucA/IucC family protein [Dactylosporangium sp. NPDC051484]|uniref:IucA/IucC family protein n=1 Tax=Dactylosporangium sp. NPDC051484 TaxID=3154942 RepID=UPI00344BABEC
MDAPDVDETLRALRAHRRDLVADFSAALPRARTAVLTRLWGALWREDVVAAGRLGGAPPPLFGPPVTRVVADGVTHDDPGALAAALGLGPQLVRELDNSVANLALAMTAQPGPGSTLADAEQSIVDGHPLHPCCRTRIGMSTLDVLAYAPEHHPTVALRLVDVDPARWRTSGRPVPPRLPVHPWQLPRALASGLVRDTGVDVPARPLMSLRTVAPIGTHWAGLHLKTAVEVQMTSAVRTLSAPAVHNGPLASQLVAELSRRTPGIHVLRELSAATVLDAAGEPQRALGALWRQAPPAGATVVPLALLPQRPDLLTPGFFAQLVDLMVPPLLRLLALGVALEAHGQNTLVEIAEGRPVRLHYRDLGGIHVHEGRLRRAGFQMPPLIGALPTGDEEALRTKLFAAAFTTVLYSLVAALGDERLWDLVAAAARASVGPADAAALFGPEWPLKATAAMRLAADPLADRWCRVPNPIQR